MPENTRPHRHLHDIRVTLGWTQQEVAKFFGVARTTYIRWEQGKVDLPEPVQGTISALLFKLRQSGAELELPQSFQNRLHEERIAGFLARPRYCYHLDSERQREGKLSFPLPTKDVITLRMRLVGWNQTQMADFFGVAQSTANSWELETASMQLWVQGALSALQDEAVYRSWTLTRGDWLAFRRALQAMGVADFLVRRRRHADWEWRQEIEDFTLMSNFKTDGEEESDAEETDVE